MIQVIRSDERGSSSLEWLESRHTFSFGSYHNPDRMGFGALRVINEDRVRPGRGFDEHGHRDMEIVSYVIDGALEHRDSMGNGSVMRPGDVQRMTAGTGVMHSEFNHSDQNPVHFLQMWIRPEADSLEPGYEQKSFPFASKTEQWCLLVSRDGREGSLSIHQDVDIQVAALEHGYKVSHRFGAGRRGWLHVIRGMVRAGGEQLSAGDGAAIKGLAELEVQSKAWSEVLLFDLA